MAFDFSTKAKLIRLRSNDLLGRRLIVSFNFRIGFYALQHSIQLSCNAERPNARIDRARKNLTKPSSCRMKAALFALRSNELLCRLLNCITQLPQQTSFSDSFNTHSVLMRSGITPELTGAPHEAFYLSRNIRA
jgi:hypothetical protein